FCTSHWSIASPPEARMVTVAYGPTTSWLTTVTDSLPEKPASFDSSLRADVESRALLDMPHPPPEELPKDCGPVAHWRVGPVMTVCVLESSAAIHASCESSTWAPGCTGSTQANSAGSPL